MTICHKTNLYRSPESRGIESLFEPVYIHQFPATTKAATVARNTKFNNNKKNKNYELKSTFNLRDNFHQKKYSSIIGVYLIISSNSHKPHIILNNPDEFGRQNKLADTRQS